MQSSESSLFFESGSFSAQLAEDVVRSRSDSHGPVQSMVASARTMSDE